MHGGGFIRGTEPEVFLIGSMRSQDVFQTIRAGRIELFSARVLCRASYRVLEYSAGCASYSPAAVTQVKVTMRKAVYRRMPDS